MRTVTYDETKKRGDPKSTHGFCSKLNRDRLPIYRIWIDMVRRCHNPKSQAFKWYGAKGIAVCERWRESFENFYTDMGDRPEGETIDRINVNGNYEPGNCRWATQTQQQRNRSNNKLTEESVAELRVLRQSGMKQKDLAAKFNICERMVRAILKGEKWA